ncbi:DUF1381 domain-containing protein [Staphylococcus intermedius]|uniref:DUF1381 domain-containing protein n=1 Tax=Staphylococcus intermedius TaxID=1285 RepID=UPI0030B907D1
MDTKDILQKVKGAGEVTQYLITAFTDSSGQTFTEVIKPRYNQTFEVVEARSKEEALSKHEEAGNND